MSAPARALPDPAPRPVPRQAPVPGRRPSPQPALPRRPAAAPDTLARPAARRFPLGFAILAWTIVGLLILGLVSLNALLAQNEFRIEALSQRIDGLSLEHGQLRREAAQLSAPGRIAEWARLHGMRLPDDIHILHVQGSALAVPAGGPDASGRGRGEP